MARHTACAVLLFAALVQVQLRRGEGFHIDGTIQNIFRLHNECCSPSLSAQHCAEEAPPPEEGGLRMVGGDVVEDPNTYSYQVAIQPLREQLGMQVPLPVCSGIIIPGRDAVGDANYFILTSAQCAVSGTKFHLWVGTPAVLPNIRYDAELDTQDIVIHEEYLRTFSKADLAIMPVPFTIKAMIEGNNPLSKKRVTYALLPNIDDLSKSYLACSVTMAGWGYPSDVFNAPSTRLRQLKSRVVPNFYCSLRQYGKTITDNHICTGGLINKGPCTGDSGAPLIYKDSKGSSRVIGLATYTPEDGCSKGRPGMFTRLSSYLDWISSITNYIPEQ